jgi:hypothetical protein
VRNARAAKRILLILFVREQWQINKRTLPSKLRICWTETVSVIYAPSNSRNAMQTKVNIPRSLAFESEQAIGFLMRISELLKHQRRHFDDAVVTHCIRLVQDYVEENIRDTPTEAPLRSKVVDRRPQ